MLRIVFLSILLSTMFADNLSAQAGKPVKNFLNVQGPLVFNKLPYQLKWSSHPSANYYKQEYINSNEDLNKFTSMIMLECLTGAATAKELIANKIAELKNMKAGNPYVNYESMYNAEKEEYILDFLVTANNPDGSIAIAERNIYRYKALPAASGQKGVLLFALSTRSYGKDVAKFLQNLKSSKADLSDKVRLFNIPAVKI
ncbi:MAG: hypothetical protein H7Y27_11305 [Gemmatimonadaceae bacterium]|nr:hypothetical protein [Chitinophagaceae bacterium]